MSYKKLIDTSLNRAYNNLKDLAIDAVLTLKEPSTFDFNNSDVKFSKPTTVKTKIVVVNTKTINKDRKVIVKELMLKSKEVGDLNAYSSIKFDSKAWNINTVLKNDGFIVMLEAYSEA
jgi:hypothetical protein